MQAPLLDTHAWVWWINGDRQLDLRVRTALDRLGPDDRPYLCDISLWEIATLVTLRRLHLAVPLDRWLDSAAGTRTVRVVSITPAVAVELARLPARFRRDPADRLIVATARAYGYPLITRDRAILRSRLVPAWSPERARGTSVRPRG
jgi:PIN domain nuclease of toxin-antitoxin system